MSISSESAEQMTRMILQGEEICLKATGKAAKEVIALIAAVMKSKSQTKGKTRLTNMLKSGKELKVFSVKKEDLKRFMQEAKRYGVLYSALVNKNNKNFDGMVDIMVRAEDASKINRIVERFKIATVNEAEIRTEIEKTRSRKEQKVAKDIGVQTKDKETLEEDKKELAPIRKEVNETNVPLVKKDNKESPLKNSSGMLKNQEGNTKAKKKSVRQELNEIKKEMSKDNKTSSEKNIAPNIKLNNKAPIKKDKTAR